MGNHHLVLTESAVNRRFAYRAVISAIIFSLLMTFTAIIPSASASGTQLPGSAHRESDGSNYWETSNLREWLNSDQMKVEYTDNPPSQSNLGANLYYDDEQGFLTNFNSSEQDSIAVTQRRSNLTTSDASFRDGGTERSPWYDGAGTPLLNYFYLGMETNWKEYYYRVTRDKVFNLSPIEAYTYAQARGLNQDGTQKSPSDALRSRENLTDQYVPYFTDYKMQSSSEFIETVETNGSIALRQPRTTQGVAPAIHVKPNTVFRDGKTAANTKIKDLVEFGTYDGEPIIWRVINRTDDGHLLLWSEEIITRKPYDAPGDTASLTSDHIDFPVTDVNLTQGLQVGTELNESTAPVIELVNREDLTQRKNGSWVMNVTASDASGIKYIILPNGSKVNGTSASYAVSNNTKYIFAAVDNNDNYSYLSVPVGNINPPANVMINPDVTGWTNRSHVNVDIFASNDIAPWTYSGTTTGLVGSSPFPTITSYAEKEFKITGTVEMVSHTGPLFSSDGKTPLYTRLGFTVRTLRDARGSSGNYLTNGWNSAFTYPSVHNIPLHEIDKTPQDFEFTYTAPGSYHDYISPLMWPHSASTSENGKYTIKWTNVKYEVVEQDDFAVEKIVLPDGTEINSDRYTDQIVTEGTHTYKVYDSRGKWTEKSIEIKIDRDKPTVNLSASTTASTHGDVIITAKGSDALSGVKRIKMPNGQWADGDTATFRAAQNGTYSFTVEDNAGNVGGTHIRVDNIDKSTSMSAPVINDFSDIVLTDDIVTTGADVSTVTVKDWSEGNNYWRVDVSASPMRNTRTGHTMPSGSLSIMPLTDITKSASGSGGTPSKVSTSSRAVDRGSPVGVALSNGSRGEHVLKFPSKALKLSVSPATAQAGSYVSTITWELVRAP